MSLLHTHLAPFYHGEQVKFGAVLTQPYMALEFAGGTSAYVDIGRLDAWTEDVCADEYAHALECLLRKYDAVLVIDYADGRPGLLVEIQDPAAESLALAFLAEYRLLFT